MKAFRTSVSEDEAKAMLPDLEAKLDKAKGILNNLLGIEKEAKKDVEKLISDITFKISHCKSIAEGNSFMMLSLDPLKWRHENGNPKLAIFSLDSPKFSLASSHDSWGGSYRTETSPKLPKEVKDCYSDVFKMLKKYNIKSSITATFNGIIPDNIKEKIKEVKGMFDQLFIIAEPTGFVKSSTAIVPKGYPLLVGWKNDTKTLWLIADFDTTAVEDAMMTEGPANTGK